jgi:phosphate transport system protein
MAEHTIKAFDAELHEIEHSIMEMGRLAASQVEDALAALTRHEPGLARAVIAADVDIDRLQREIEEKSVLAIARRQPMAVDLREIIGALRIVNGLERIGDYAKNIGKRAIATGPNTGPAAAVRGLQDMSHLVLTALRQVLDAYQHRDSALALAVWRGDQAIDAAHDALFRQLLSHMMQEPAAIPACTQLLFCAKNIERVGDHATNIAETVCYMVQGVPLDSERPKGI